MEKLLAKLTRFTEPELEAFIHFLEDPLLISCPKIQKPPRKIIDFIKNVLVPKLIEFKKLGIAKQYDPQFWVEKLFFYMYPGQKVNVKKVLPKLTPVNKLIPPFLADYFRRRALFNNNPDPYYLLALREKEFHKDLSMTIQRISFSPIENITSRAEIYEQIFLTNESVNHYHEARLISGKASQEEKKLLNRLHNLNELGYYINLLRIKCKVLNDTRLGWRTLSLEIFSPLPENFAHKFPNSEILQILISIEQMQCTNVILRSSWIKTVNRLLKFAKLDMTDVGPELYRHLLNIGGVYYNTSVSRVFISVLERLYERSISNGAALYKGQLPAAIFINYSTILLLQNYTVKATQFVNDWKHKMPKKEIAIGVPKLIEARISFLNEDYLETLNKLKGYHPKGKRLIAKYSLEIKSLVFVDTDLLEYRADAMKKWMREWKKQIPNSRYSHELYRLKIIIRMVKLINSSNKKQLSKILKEIRNEPFDQAWLLKTYNHFFR